MNLGKWYTHKWFDVKYEPPEGYLAYALYKIMFRVAHPKWGLSRRRMNYHFIKKRLVAIDSLILTHEVGEFLDFKSTQRIQAARKSKLTWASIVDQEALQKVLPSINNIRVVDFQGQCLVIDGNGRTHVLKHTLRQGTLVEVDEVSIEGPVQYKIKKFDTGTLRVIKKFAWRPIEFELHNKVWLEQYFCVQEYTEWRGPYGDISFGWSSRLRWPCNKAVHSLLTDPDEHRRNCGKFLYEQGQETK